MLPKFENIQGVFFNWSYPKNHKYGKKFKYQNWSYPKIHKYGKKFKYQNWSSPEIHKYQNWSPPQKTETRTIVGYSTIYSLRLRDSRDSQDSETPETPRLPRLRDSRGFCHITFQFSFISDLPLFQIFQILQILK